MSRLVISAKSMAILDLVFQIKKEFELLMPIGMNPLHGVTIHMKEGGFTKVTLSNPYYHEKVSISFYIEKKEEEWRIISSDEKRPITVRTKEDTFYFTSEDKGLLSKSYKLRVRRKDGSLF